MRKPQVLAALAGIGLFLALPAFAQDVQRAVGSETCASCHEEQARPFERSAHGQLAPFERRGLQAGCESCHGAGGKHVDSGSSDDIRVFADLAARQSTQACLACHRHDAAMNWAGSEHAAGEVACTSCHRIHQSRQVAAVPAAEGFVRPHATAPAEKGSLDGKQSDVCFKCHPDQRAKLALSSRHPVREGRMTCASCHDVHGGVPGVGMIKTAERVNDLCVSCHASKQGPFAFEHQPVEESCLTCHDPHGTVANNLLKQGEPFICLQCHEMHFHSARVTPGTPFYLPAGGSENPNGVTGFQQAYNTRCTACHSRVHGSDQPSQGVTGRGKALTR